MSPEIETVPAANGNFSPSLHLGFRGFDQTKQPTAWLAFPWLQPLPAATGLEVAEKSTVFGKAEARRGAGLEEQMRVMNVQWRFIPRAFPQVSGRKKAPTELSARNPC